MLTFIHTHINISSTTKSGATIWNGREKLCTGIYNWATDVRQITDAGLYLLLLYCFSLTGAGKVAVAVKPIAHFFTSHAIATATHKVIATQYSAMHPPHFEILVHDLVHRGLFVP